MDRRGRTPRARAVVSILATWLALAPVAFAQDVEVEPPPGDKLQTWTIPPTIDPFPIAYPDLKVCPEVGFTNPLVTDLPARLVEDLELSGYFARVPKATYIEDSQASGIQPARIDFTAWRLIGADYLIKGELCRDGIDMRLELRFFDVAQSEQLEGRLYKVPEVQLRLAVHDFANHIMASVLGGEPGAFGTRISFVTNRGRRKDRKEIFVVDSDGAQLTPVTRNESLNLLPDWSPDGRSLAYTSYKRNNPDIWITEIFTGRSRSLVAKGLNIGPSWSPDGRTLAFSRNNDLYLVQSDGSGLTRLTSTRAIEAEVDWSPDGQTLAFTSNRKGGPHIWRIGSDGKDARLLIGGSFHHGNPTFSPDGRKIAYTKELSGGWRIFVADADGTGEVQVTTGPGNDEHPSWSPDGRILVFGSTRGKTSSLYLVPPLGVAGDRDRAVRITDDEGNDVDPTWAPRSRR